MEKLYIIYLILLLPLGSFATEKIHTPVPNFPEDGQTEISPEVTISWDAVCGVDSLCYIVQFDTTSLFTDPIERECKVTGSTFSGLEFGNTYYWRVKAQDVTGTGNWCQAQSFTVLQQMECDKPADGVEDLEIEPDLMWKKVKGISQYHLMVDTSAGFDSPLLKSYDVAGNLRKVSLQQLFFNQTYYWKVRGHHAMDTTHWSHVRTFTTLTGTSIEEPIDGAGGQMLDVKLIWKPVTGARRYEYQINHSADMSEAVAYPSYETEIVPPQLSFGDTCFWRVRVINSKDTSLWSPVTSFSTIKQVNIKSPSDGAEEVASQPTFKWQAITGIDGYILALDDTPDFEAFPTYIEAGKNSFVPDRHLKKGETYYWKMRAVHQHDSTIWTQVRTFTTQQAPSGVNDNDNRWRIYPVPCDQQLVIEKGPVAYEEQRIFLYDLTGQIIHSAVIDDQNKVTLNTGFFNAGVYILRIEGIKTSYNQRIVINH
ncbi:MAG: T9SS type A sorting domain-containing protein [Bacteroidales bacterium]|nr:T9SS type A sorting domain-containing protein [Bacteroidales bacterium]MCF8332972.1 T9SS type A sorting domain-containing protein [Bacteroidales bacterium]